MTRPVVVVPEVAEHGVTLFAAALARAAQAIDAVPGAALGDVPPGAAVHVQFTDRLWGADPDAAATALEQVARRHPLTVTLHDVPQPSDGPVNLVRRGAAYARVVRAARAVAVSSRYERGLLAAHTPGATDALDGVAVIPLPVTAPPAPPAGAVGRDVAVLGFFYPGKGHDEALAAAVAAGADAVTVLGRASPGHEGDLTAFARRAEAAGLGVEVTGYLPDDELVARARRVGVPVAAPRHVSASASLGAWLAAGRRPVVVATDYTAEYAALRPGALALTDDLDAAVAAALADPSSTWLRPGTTLPWDAADAARAHLDWWETLS